VSKKEKVICGLDIGTTKVCMIIGRTGTAGDLEILSTGYALSGGLKKGVVVDLEEAALSIRKAADEAEMKSGLSVDWVTVGISGSHVQSFNCKGAIALENRHHEVTPEAMAQVIHAAQSVPIPPGREIIHALPLEFQLDSRGEIRNPVGLTGSRLDVSVHVVTCESFLLQNLVNAVNRAQMRVRKVVLQPLASAEAVLGGDERELGSAVVDVGGGTTDIALFSRNTILNTAVLPLGGDHFTRDLAIGLRTPLPEAERIKKTAGSVEVDSIAEDEAVEIPGVGNRQVRIVPRRVACEILRYRAVELLELVKEQIFRSADRDELAGGVVLTGGGSLLDGMLHLAEEILELPVRQGYPAGILGLSEDLTHPVYATAIGLARFEILEAGDVTRKPGKGNPSPWFFNKFLSWVSS